MKKFYSKLKTSDKINFLFSLFNFVSLLILLIGVNIIYFFIWYSDQKEESWYDMNKNYNNFIEEKSEKNIEAFKKYILQKDTLIIPKDGGELECSNGVETKIHNDINKIQNNLFYNNGEKIFFIYSKIYPEIGEVKVFFDTTSYVKSQIIIIKISVFIILFSLFIYIIIGNKITKYAFKNLKKISKKAGFLDIEKNFEKIKILGNKNDEINILANTINNSFCHIKKQTSNLKQFTTDVAHEFKTPLMIINSEIDLYNKKLEKNKLEKNSIENLHKNIKQNTKKLNNLLETFLLLSRVENSIENLEKKEVDLGEYLKDFINKYITENNLEKNNIKINFNLEKNIYINLEENTFNVLIGNLLSNAIKFSKNNKKDKRLQPFVDKIQINIELTTKYFSIKDNGIGIKKDDIKNIFNKFSRIDNKIEGFGVGLFLVKRLSDLYNWEIKVESKEGGGAKFIIEF